MSFLSEIFQSTGDQARLVTTLIAAIIAVVVVFLTQYFNANRAKKEKHIEKIEEMYSALIKMQTLSANLHNEIIKSFNMVEERRRLFDLNDEFVAVSEIAYMLSSLYFTSLTEKLSEIRLEHDKVHSAFVNANTLNDYIDKSEVHKANHSKLYLDLYSDLTVIMKKTMH